MGAGERMVRAVDDGKVMPHLVTLGIAALLVIWAAYAWSGAGLIPELPPLRPALAAITGVYLLGAALPLLSRTMPDRGWTFLVSSSLIVAVIGTVHAIGICRTA